jgi:hypothetical protein
MSLGVCRITTRSLRLSDSRVDCERTITPGFDDM